MLRHLGCLRRLDASQLRRGKPLESLSRDDAEVFLNDCQHSNLLKYCCMIYTNPEKCGGVGTGFANFLADEQFISPQELESIRVYVTAKKREGRRRRYESAQHNQKRVSLSARYLRPMRLHADRMVRMMIDFILAFANRISEGPCHVRLEDIDFKKKTVTFYIKPRGKKHVLPFDEKDERFIRSIIWFREIYAGRQIEDTPAAGFLFTTRRARWWTTGNAEDHMKDIRDSIADCKEHDECREMREQNKLHLVSWHVLRYTAARRAYDRTKNIVYVRDLLGHTSVIQTEHYLALDEEEKLDRLRRGHE